MCGSNLDKKGIRINSNNPTLNPNHVLAWPVRGSSLKRNGIRINFNSPTLNPNHVPVPTSTLAVCHRELLARTGRQYWKPHIQHPLRRNCALNSGGGLTRKGTVPRRLPLPQALPSYQFIFWNLTTRQTPSRSVCPRLVMISIEPSISSRLITVPTGALSLQ